MTVIATVKLTILNVDPGTDAQAAALAATKLVAPEFGYSEDGHEFTGSEYVVTTTEP